MWKNESTGRVINDSHYKKLTPAHKEQYTPYTPPPEETAPPEDTKPKKVYEDQEDEDEDDSYEVNSTLGLSNFENDPDTDIPQTDQEPDMGGFDNVHNPAEFGGFGGGDAGGGGAGGEF